MKLVVGLGNPGLEYKNTRHNVGFNFIDGYLKNRNFLSNWSKKFNSLILKTKINNYDVIFLKPQTFMNLSGDSVKKIIDYYKINIDDILVVSDDLDLNLGNFKLKKSGSCGGHNGLRDIENKIGTNIFKRLKIGISNNKQYDTKDYVLGSLSKNEMNTLNDLFINLYDVLDDYFFISFDVLMNKYNQKNK